MSRLEELEKRKETLECELVKVKEQIYQAKLEQNGLSIGCIVTSKGNEFKLTKADFWNKENPWIYGFSKTKKGDWSKSEKCIYSDWELK